MQHNYVAEKILNFSRPMQHNRVAEKIFNFSRPMQHNYVAGIFFTFSRPTQHNFVASDVNIICLHASISGKNFLAQFWHILDTL